jgi:MFS family permease
MTSVWYCIAGNLLLRLSNSSTGVLMGLLLASIDRQQGDVPAVAVGLLAASFYVAELLAAPWFGALSDRYGRRLFMIAGPIFGALAVQLIGWPSLLVGWPMLLWIMAIGRIVEGLSAASSVPATLSYLSSETAGDAANRGRVMAWYEMATVVGIGGGFVAAGLLWDRLGHGAFLAVTAVYPLSIAAFAAVGKPRPSRGGRTSRSPALLGVLRRPSILRFVPAWLCVNTVAGLWFTHSAFQFTGEQQAGQYLSGAFTGASLSAGFALFSGAFIVGVYLWGVTLGTHRKTSIMALTVSGLYAVCLSLFVLNHLGQAGGLSVTVPTVAFLISAVVASGFTPAALAYLADISEETAEQRGAVMGLYSVILGLGQLLGGALGGPFADAGGVDGLILLTALLTTGALATVLALRHFEREEMAAGDRPRASS